MSTPFTRDNPIFKNITKMDSCPNATDICNGKVISTDIDFYRIPYCDNFEFKSSNKEVGDGCCKVKTEGEFCSDSKYADSNYHDIGISILDSNSKALKVCHSNPFKKNMPSLAKFFKIMAATLVALILTTIIGATIEFWLKYGHAKDCIFYRSKCKNINSSTNGESTLVEHMFPDNICYFPYQPCDKKSSQSGGEKALRGGTNKFGIISNLDDYRANAAKCVTVDYGGIENNRRPFPYNIADYAEENIESALLRMPFKAFSFFFMYTVIVTRFVLKAIFKNLSIAYQNNVKDNNILSNIVFFILMTLGIIPIGSILLLITIISGLSQIISFILIILPKKFLGKQLAKCNIDPDYYSIFSKKLFYPLMEESIATKIKHCFYNIFMGLMAFIMFIFSFFVSGPLGLIFSSLYLNFVIILKIFYIPLSNFTELLDIIKNHGDLLTILFCANVVLSSANSLDSSVTGVMSGILGILIIYKLINGIKQAAK